MFGRSKKVSVLKRLRDNTSLLVVGSVLLFVVIVLTAYKPRLFPLWAILAALIVLTIKRLFHGKLKLSEGDVILFWGLQGSGKTLFLTKTIIDNPQLNYYANEEYFTSTSLPIACMPRAAWGFFAPETVDNCFVIDEASLDGWDSRDWSKNFVPESLEAWKKIRHSYGCAIMSNQGFNELDCKIRDSLTTCIYYVENRGKYSRAIRMDKDVTFSEETGLPVEGYRQPSLFDRLKDPSCVIYCNHKKIGEFYRTHNPRKLLPLKDYALYEPVKNSKGQTIRYKLKQVDIEE